MPSSGFTLRPMSPTTETAFDSYRSNFFESNLYSNLVPSNHLNLESPSVLLVAVKMNTADASTIVLPLPEKAAPSA